MTTDSDVWIEFGSQVVADPKYYRHIRSVISGPYGSSSGGSQLVVQFNLTAYVRDMIRSFSAETTPPV